MKRKAHEVVIFLLTGVAAAIALVLVAGERGRCTEGRGSDEGSSLEGAI